MNAEKSVFILCINIFHELIDGRVQTNILPVSQNVVVGCLYKRT